MRAAFMMLVFLLGASITYAGRNDIPSTVKIGNVTVEPRDGKTRTLRFDLSWDHSWRHEVNHDAIWVFFKVRAEGGTGWQHVRLAADPASPKGSAAASKVLNPAGYGQAEGTPLEYIVPGGKDGFLGMFVRTAEFGAGSVKATGVTAVWDFSANQGIEKDTKVDIMPVGIEMTYIPEGAFDLGGGTTEKARLYKYTDGKQSGLPYRITSEDAIPTGKKNGSLWATDLQPADGGKLTAAFPKGFAAVYCMKKVAACWQYAAFLSTLTPEQYERHQPNKLGEGKRLIVRSGEAPDFTYTYKENTANHWCTGLNWEDEVTFVAWAGLRPFTELEFEKIGHGPMQYGWDTGDELDHPAYWGIDEWNGWRKPRGHIVTVANEKGRSFKGTHGNGTTSVPADWPQADAVGAGSRGQSGPDGRWSSRHLATTMNLDSGIRAVRTAPIEAAEQ
ncbi:MAG: hypothetical protein QGH29_04660 [Kiritimatiellia bacterium]|nr:hypothetical protein [Kiritimatiellia bacterium]MDP6811551.1 hypothetical protein [Kiritimatiellia bacterium]